MFQRYDITEAVVGLWNNKIQLPYVHTRIFQVLTLELAVLALKDLKVVGNGENIT